jgi:hypothetical protein
MYFPCCLITMYFNIYLPFFVPSFELHLDIFFFFLKFLPPSFRDELWIKDEIKAQRLGDFMNNSIITLLKKLQIVCSLNFLIEWPF